MIIQKTEVPLWRNSQLSGNMLIIPLLNILPIRVVWPYGGEKNVTSAFVVFLSYYARYIWGQRPEGR